MGNIDFKRWGVTSGVSLLALGLATFLSGLAVGLAVFFVASVVSHVGYHIALGGTDGDGNRVATRRSLGVGMLLPLGLALLFISERVIGEGHDQLWTWRGLAIVCFTGVVAWRGYELSRSSGNQRRVEIRLAVATAFVFLGLGLFVLSTDWGIEAMGFTDSAAERMSGVLGVLWVAVAVVSLAELFFMSAAYRQMPVEEAVELRRIKSAARTGLTLGLSLVFVASINYAANERDITRDLSYFKTTVPSETSLRMVRSLDEPIEVVLVYPRVNEVLEQVRPFFDQLAQESEHVTVTVRDHALAPQLAQQHQIPRNGFVVLLRGEGEGQSHEKVEVGLELDAARRRLRTLDGLFQQHFAALTTRPRELHVTAGHDERSARGTGTDSAEQRLSLFHEALERTNIQSRDLGLAQGLANGVPEGARAVAVIGPRSPLLPEEAQSLLTYVQGGGRLMVFVDPDVDHGLDPLLHGLGLTLRTGVLNSEQSHLRRTAPPADRQVVFTNTYSAHPTVTIANRNRRVLASVFNRGGALEQRPADAIEGASATFPIRTGPGFWLDLDDDHSQDADEPADPRFYMMAAVTVPQQGEAEEGRAVVVADGDFIADALIGNRGNHLVLTDMVNWLVGEDRILGPTETEEDIRIEHTREEDKLWFYATSFGAPLPLILGGVFVALRRRRGGAQRGPKKAAPANKHPEPSPETQPSAPPPAEEEE